MSETLTLNERVDEAVRSLNELFNPYGGKIYLNEDEELPFIEPSLHDEHNQIIFYIRYEVYDTDTPDKIAEFFLSQLKLKLTTARSLVEFMNQGVMCDAN